MLRRDALRLMAGVPVAAMATVWPIDACAQVTRGFNNTLRAIASGEEIQRQPDLWVFEIQFKPMRMIYADITDPQTGQVSRDQIWYLCYRTINRKLTARQDNSNTTPVNVLDPLAGPSQFLPEFSLMTHEEPGSEIPSATELDVILPEATAVINNAERRRTNEPPFQNTVEVVQPLPDPVDSDVADPVWIYGVATWRNIDPDTDFFSIVMRGFSNGYELREGPDGSLIVWRKSIRQKFTRRGDRFDPDQIEFEFDGQPQWVYLPDQADAAEEPAPAAPVES